MIEEDRKEIQRCGEMITNLRTDNVALNSTLEKTKSANSKEQNSLRVKLTMIEAERNAIFEVIKLFANGPKHSPLHPSN